MRPSAKTGDAENVPLTRCCHKMSPVLASRQLAMPASVTRYSSSPTSSGEGVSGRRAVRPADVGLRHVAGPVGPDGHDLRLKESRGDVDESVSVDRPWHVGKTISIADAPDFLARRRLVGRRPKRANADNLISVADANYERSGVSLVRWLTPRRFPARLAGALVERDDEGLVPPSQSMMSRSP